MTDDGLAQLVRMPRLTFLWIASPALSKKCLPSLAQMQSLRVLYVSKDIRIDERSLADLGRHHLKQCTIMRDIGRGRRIFDPRKH